MTESEKESALRKAAILGDYEAVIALLAQGVSVDAADVNGWTTLMLAAKQNHAELVTLLVEHGATVNATNKHNRTALRYAAERGDTPIQYYLLEHDADPTLGRDDGVELILSAIKFGHIDLVERFLDRGVAINAHWVLLIVAIGAGEAAIVRLLLEHGADPNLVQKAKFVRTPLSEAIEHFRPDLVAMLIDYGADVNARKFRDETPLVTARQAYERACSRQEPETMQRAEAVIALLRNAGAQEPTQFAERKQTS